MSKVLITDRLSPKAREILRQRGIDAEAATGLKPQELTERLPAYDGLIIRSATKVTREILVATDRLKVIGRAGIGVDNVDLTAATQRGVVVMNAPGGNSITTAEHAISMMLALARQIPAADRSTRAGNWEKSRFVGVEITNKLLGIIGCGNVGSIVAKRARGLKMRVKAYDPYLSQERAHDLEVDKVDTLDELYKESDFITIHVPLTKQTRHMIDADTLSRMKPGVRIINCARGGLIDEVALKEAIEGGHIAGAAIDVFEEEPAYRNPLFELDEVICTPHLGASTSEAQEKVAIQIAEQVADYLLTGAISNALNMPSLTAEESARLGPYMRLGEQLGSFAGQLTESGLQAVKCEYEGYVATLNTRALTQIALSSLLSPMLDSVNMVNAPVVARERDIDVSEVKHERAGDYQTLIRLTVTTDRQVRSVAGTLFGGNKPRIVEIKGISIEAELGPHMLYITNEDRPGFIGKLGMVLGNADVNIATFHLGRVTPGADAIALLEVDEQVPEDVLQELRELPHIKQVKTLRF